MVASGRIGSVEITVFEDDIIEVVVREKVGGVYWPVCRRFCRLCVQDDIATDTSTKLYPYSAYIYTS